MKTRRLLSSLEVLEDRIAPAAVSIIREATAAGPQASAQAGIQATFDAFRADLGSVNNGNAVGSQGTGLRLITWDGGDNDAAPARLPGDFFNAIAPRGAVFGGDPRLQFQVSADTTPAVPGTLTEFGNVNATYPTAFSAFSSPRLFSALNSNVFEVAFFIPGTDQPAAVSGFGAVFTDVDMANSSKIEYLDRHGNVLFERAVLATFGDESLSFLGVVFDESAIARVRITAGEAPLGANDITQAGANDIVALDDFVYGEPQPLATALISDRVLHVFGDNGANKISVKVGKTSTSVDIDGYKLAFNALDFSGVSIRGEGGDDVIKISGKPGGLTVDAGDGNDTVIGTATGAVLVDGQSGNDVIKITGKPLSLIATGGDGNDRITGTASGVVSVEGGGEDDFIKIAGKPLRLTIAGGAGNDTLAGTAIEDVLIMGGLGNDTIKVTGKPAGVIVDGGDGNDTISGTGARDVLVGGLGDDLLKGGGGEDVLIGGGTSFSESELRAILAVWADPAEDFVSRIAVLQAGSANFPAFTPANLSDTGVDVLDGGGALDWFLANSADEIRPKLFPDEVFTAL